MRVQSYMVTLYRQRSPWSRIRPAAGFPRVPRKPGLDGLRALAVIAVVVYHLNPGWLPGGFLGVEVLFVVSGYLITSLLVSEFGRSGTIDLKKFWLARARGLVPSVLALLGAVILLSCLFARDALPALRTDVPFSLLFVVNWWLIVHHVSSFSWTGRPPLLVHLWPLAVGAQFSVLWPPLLLLLLRRVNLRLVLAVALIGAAASSWWMGVLSHAGLDPSRSYFGTDSHAQGLLIGCALSILVPPWGPRAEVARSARRLLGVVGAAALAGLGSLLATLGPHAAFAYPVGFVLVDLCAAVLIVMVVHPATWLTLVASLPMLRWVGVRSYALYLWHWPIIQLTRPDQDIHLGGWRLLLLRLALIAVAAELSHRLVEVPFKRPGVWTGWQRRVRTGAAGPIWAGLSSAVVAGLGALLLVVPGSISPIASLAMNTATQSRRPAGSGHGRTSPTVLPLITPVRSASPAAASSAGPESSRIPRTSTKTTTPTTAAPTTSTTSPPTTLSPQAAALAAKEPVLAIGDSVMLAAKPAFTATFGPEIRVDAAIGRQVTQGVNVLEHYRATGELAQFKTVVIALGTNGPLTPALFNELVVALKGVPYVVFYNTYDTKPWEATTNATLATETATHPGTIEINWAALAPGPGLLDADKTRPTPAGATAYASLLGSALS